MWKSLVDAKYDTHNPNIFCSSTSGISQFWKGVMWAAESVKFGYRWKVGDGTKIRFWEDTWFGTSPLAVQFFDLYIVCNEQNKTISQIWDGNTLMLTFRRNFPPALMQKWQELEEIVRSTTLSTECDSLIWKYESSGVYSSSSLYAIINFGGVMPIYIPAVWKLIVPPRVHIFLWLLSHNKLMTRDNLLKRNLNKPVCCVFCSENESIDHLFFQCIVAKQIWKFITSVFNIQVGHDYISVARFWVANKKHPALNSICAATLWCIWKFRNDMIFNGQTWLNLHQILRMILLSVRRWKIIFKDHMLPLVDHFCDLTLKETLANFCIEGG
jgi:hypothetical protein